MPFATISDNLFYNIFKAVKFRVVPAVAHWHPHRPGRAQLTHPVLQIIGSLRESTFSIDRVYDSWHWQREVVFQHFSVSFPV